MKRCYAKLYQEINNQIPLDCKRTHSFAYQTASGLYGQKNLHLARENYTGGSQEKA